MKALIEDTWVVAGGLVGWALAALHGSPTRAARRWQAALDALEANHWRRLREQAKA